MSLTDLNLSVSDKLVLEATNEGANAYKPQGDKIFKQVEAQRLNEKFSIHAVDGSFSSVGESAAYPAVNVDEVASKTLSQVSYKKEIPVSKLMQRFGSAYNGVVMEIAGKLGYQANHTIDTLKANILVNADGSTTTAHGYALEYASQPIGNLPGQTQSNTIPGALSETNLNEANKILNKQKSHDGLIGGACPRGCKKYLVVPEELAMTGYKLTKSQTGPETANRETGYINTLGIELVVWPLLTSTTDWFLIADKRWSSLRYAYKIQPTTNVVAHSETNGSKLYQIDFTGVAGAPDYLGFAAYTA